MASSRWKRFAFFDRQNLSIPSSVVNDLLQNGDNNMTITSSGRLSPAATTESGSMNTISMAITTASLPAKNGEFKNDEQQEQANEAISAMWSSLSACQNATATLEGTTGTDNTNTMLLPSQRQSNITTTSSQSSSDGLVLLFVASSSSKIIHCFDMTVRCSSTTPTDHQDLDGWRGYYSTTNKIVGLTTARVNDLHVVTISNHNDVQVHVNPHLNLSCRLPLQQSTNNTTPPQLSYSWKQHDYGTATVVDMIVVSNNGDCCYVAVGTDTGVVLWLKYNLQQNFTLIMTIPAPRHSSIRVTSVKWSSPQALFVGYSSSSSSAKTSTSSASPKSPPTTASSGICCFELPVLTDNHKFPTAPSARHDLDGRHVQSQVLCDVIQTTSGGDYNYMVARPDGLYTYSKTQKIHVSPIDGTKHCMCSIHGESYALVASTDVKSGRDAVDVYDAVHKLVAFHVLLSPGHKALRAVGMTSSKKNGGGRSSAIVLTSGGSIVTLTEKDISEKVSLLVQKNLYSAAISMAYADPSFQPADITALYRRHAEHLYRKGDFSAAMDQYIYTIGSLESSHVIFRYLDAPKIPLLAKYLEELRSRDLATPVHNELLRTCYLKLNDNEAAEKIAAFASSAAHTSSSATSLVSSLAHTPKEALATVCSLEAPQAAEALVVHGAGLARAFPRETAGLVVSLCVGTYSPSALKELTTKSASGENVSKILEHVAMDDHTKRCDPYPVHLFAPAFVEHPKMLRLILAHCNRNKCYLTPSLRRTMLELTLAEWNQAKRKGDTEAEKLRRREAIAALTDAHSRDIGDYDALVIVQLAGFAEGELLLYERMQMTPMLLARYAQDGGDRARRHMLAMCRSDPEILADVLGHFVAIASEKIDHDGAADDASTRSEEEDILDDIREALALAKAQGALPPVRIARILAGEGVGQFSADAHRNETQTQQTVPLSVALDYVGAILDDSRKEISRLKADVEEYNQLCNSMEAEINSLLTASMPPSTRATDEEGKASRINIDELHAKMREAVEEGATFENISMSEKAREAFWREMNQSEDRFETIARFYAKGIIQ